MSWLNVPGLLNHGSSFKYSVKCMRNFSTFICFLTRLFSTNKFVISTIHGLTLNEYHNFEHVLCNVTKLVPFYLLSTEGALKENWSSTCFQKNYENFFKFLPNKCFKLLQKSFLKHTKNKIWETIRSVLPPFNPVYSESYNTQHVLRQQLLYWSCSYVPLKVLPLCP